MPPSKLLQLLRLLFQLTLLTLLLLTPLLPPHAGPTASEALWAERRDRKSVV